MKITDSDLQEPSPTSISRREAIEKGMITDLMEDKTRDMVLSMGFPFPLAITYSAECDTIYCSKDAKSASNFFSPSLFAVLQALRAAFENGNPKENTYFSVPPPHSEESSLWLRSVYELDDGSPVITITSLSEWKAP